jgi:hypothetical protein
VFFEQKIVAGTGGFCPTLPTAWIAQLVAFVNNA